MSDSMAKATEEAAVRQEENVQGNAQGGVEAHAGGAMGGGATGGGGTGDAGAAVEAPAGQTRGVLDIARIMEAIPHRFPFLLVDRVVDLIPGTSATGIKNVSINEHVFQGHFPGHPIFPGVMIIESMAQTAGVLVVETLGESARGKLVYFMSVEGAKFRKPVVPGDQMRVHVTRERQRGNVWKFSAQAKVDGVVVAEATFAAMILDG